MGPIRRFKEAIVRFDIERRRGAGCDRLLSLARESLFGIHQKFRFLQKKAASSLFQNAFALPGAQDAADGEWRYIRTSSQVFVGDSNFDAIRTGLADPASQAEQQACNATRSVVRH